MTDRDPYAPPEAELSNPGDAPALWNPEAAAAWSLMLSTVLGTTLVHLNWRAMGELRRANVALTWVAGSVAALIGTLFAHPVIGMGFLLAWYFFAVRPQKREIENRYGIHYPRRSWLVPVVAGFAASIVVVNLPEVFGLEM